MASETTTPGIDNPFRSEYQKTSERARLSADSTLNPGTKRDLGDKTSDVADDVASKAKDAGDAFIDKAGEVGHSMQETGHNIAEKTKHTHQAIRRFTKENPTAAVLMAFGVGAMLARMLPGR